MHITDPHLLEMFPPAGSFSSDALREAQCALSTFSSDHDMLVPQPSVLERAMIDAAPDGMLLVDSQGRILLANAAMETMSGHAAALLRGQTVDVFLPEPMRAQHAQMMRDYFLKPTQRAMGGMADQLRLYCRDGSSIPVDIALSHCQMGEDTCVVAFVRDLSNFKRLEDQMEYLAQHDTLTGLANRWQFMRHLNLALAQTGRSRQPVALLLLDLDDFKIINDGHGHAAGDLVLIETARRLKSVLRGGDMLARLGGDEFTVLLGDLATPQDAALVADKLLAALAEPYQVQGCEVFPGASVGIACAPDDADDAETLMRFADMAMYLAKEGGRNRYAHYVPELGRQREAVGRMRDRLKQAILNDGLTLAYQPQVDVNSGQLVGVEALLRWHDSELGQVPPDRFVPVAESSGLMLALGNWVLETACRQLAQWTQEGVRLRMAINLSVQQFRQPDLCERLTQLLHTHGLQPAWIELEITESEAMSDPEQARSTLTRLANMGIQLALDDFGTGHSSLSYLKLLPIHRIKIDRSFVGQIHENADDAVLVKAIIALAHTLGQEVVAEGVETREQLQFLAEQQCEYFQGWLYAKALPADELRALFRVAV